MDSLWGWQSVTMEVPKQYKANYTVGVGGHYPNLAGEESFWKPPIGQQLLGKSMP